MSQQGLLGTDVVLVGLVNRPELNGRKGRVIDARTSGRWGVQLEPALEAPIAVRDKNLAPWVRTHGPSLAETVADRLHSPERLADLMEREAPTKPSYSGPARDCRHGGPLPSEGSTTELFCAAFGGALRASGEQIDAAQRAFQAGEVDESAFINVSIRSQFEYWAKPEFAQVIEANSYKVVFSCAVDAVIDSNFGGARHMVRVGAFVRMWAQHGGAQLMADCTAGGDDEAAAARLAPMKKCLWKTRTDRGIALYLGDQLPCGCLSQIVEEFKSQEKTFKCQNSACQQQLPVSQLKTCSRCKTAQYCGSACQEAHWKMHKKKCAQLAASGGGHGLRY